MAECGAVAAGAARNAGPPWRCDILASLAEAQSCSSVHAEHCDLHFARLADGRMTRCHASGLGCVNGTPVAGCPQFCTNVAADVIKACVRDITHILWTNVSSSGLHALGTEVSGEQRLYHSISLISATFDKAYDALGLLGPQTCALFVGMPIGHNEDRDAKSTSYNLGLFDNMICPNLIKDDITQDSAAYKEREAASWPAGSLTFRCWTTSKGGGSTNQTVRLSTAMRYNFKSASLSDTAVPSPRQSIEARQHAHALACSFFGHGGAVFEYKPWSVSADGFRHAHLPARSCHELRDTGLDYLHTLLRLQTYLLNTVRLSTWKVDLLHEFGVYLARRLLGSGDDRALSEAWQLLVNFYVTTSPLHGFVWEVLLQRETVDGLPAASWAAQFCSNFLLSSAAMGNPRASDTGHHLFSECAHGVGHGSRMLFGNASLCTPTASLVADMPGMPAYAQRLWMHSCREGIVHQMLNDNTRARSWTIAKASISALVRQYRGATAWRSGARARGALHASLRDPASAALKQRGLELFSSGTFWAQSLDQQQESVDALLDVYSSSNPPTPWVGQLAASRTALLYLSSNTGRASAPAPTLDSLRPAQRPYA